MNSEDGIRAGEAGKESGSSDVPPWSHWRDALEGSRIAILVQDREGRHVGAFNPPPFLRDRPLAGRTASELFPAAAAAQLDEARAEAIANGHASEVEVELPDSQGSRWYDVAVKPRYDEEGGIVGTVLSAIDVTDRKVQEEHLRIVLRELAHRSKNLLAVIQGIARQTAESAHTTEQFVSRFNGRIFSLSRAHDVLTDADWRGARIFDLIRSQVALYAEDRLRSVSLEGDNQFLRPNAAQYLGLALHELTTNAIKYGALSVADGEVWVRFERSAGDPAMHRFTWSEHKGPPVRQPKGGRSFGLMMISQVVPAAVGGSAQVSFDEAGLSYELQIPRAQLVT